jgi:signal transduction histidine kinase
MRLRASLIGGRLEIHGGPGKGTEVILQWPQPAE